MTEMLPTTEMDGIWVHNKTGNRYKVMTCVTNTTNDVDGQRMVLYYSLEERFLLPFVREKEEFEDKFTRE